MASWDYTEWYNRQPVWQRVLLFPILFPVILFHGTVVMVFFLLIILPFLLVKGWIESRRFWRKLRERGQIGLWPEVEPQVSNGSGTLIVEVTPKGPGCSWLIDLPRDAVDPEHVVPSWQQFEEQGWDVFESPPTAFESMNRWTLERLGAYESSARALVPSWKQLAGLALEAKQRSVLAVLCWCEGCLTSRCT
jgi:hypothetical protein